MSGPLVYQHGLFDLVLTPLGIRSTIPLNVHLHEIFCAGTLRANYRIDWFPDSQPKAILGVNPNLPK
jgi:hypothetical protein